MASWMHTRLLVLVALSVTHSSCHQQCDLWSPHSDSTELVQDANCYNLDGGAVELGCNTRDPVVSWNLNMSNHIIGEMEVDFLLLQDPGTYRIFLEHSDVTEETCHHSSAHFKTHSMREFTVASSSATDLQNTTCGETGRVWFYYVYTGCYRINFNLWNDGVYMYSSCPRFLKTSYVKKLLDKAPVLNSEYNFLHSTLRLTVNMGPEIRVVQVNVKLSSEIDLDMGSDVCQKSGVEEVCCSHMPEEPQPTRCRTSKAYSANATCHSDDTSLVCLVSDVEPGDYCMIVSVKDERCYEDTVWMNSNNKYLCRWYLLFRANETSSSSDIMTVSTDGWTKMLLYWCVAIMFVLILAGVAVACWLCTKDGFAKRKDIKEIFSNLEYSYSSLNRKRQANNQGATTEVLLLYSRDCDPFMNLMTVFRNNLKKLGLKVHDCFDPECQEPVSLGPTQWLRHLLSRPEVKVVVVSSECARRRQEALDACVLLHYAQPHPFAPLFTCALEYIVREARKDSYEHEFHVRFHKFTDEQHMLAHVTPLRIYTLPKHFSLLLQNLTNRCDIADAEVDIDDNNVFDEPLDKLIRYKQQNPNYLDQLLLHPATHPKVEQHRFSAPSCDQQQR